MKKILILLLTLTCILSFTACSSEQSIQDNLSSVRFDILEGETDSYLLKCYNNYSEHPKEIDGKIGEKLYNVEFVLMDKVATVDKEYSVEFELNGNTFKDDFYIDSYTYKQTCIIFTTEQPPENLTVTISTTDHQESIELSTVTAKDKLHYSVIAEKTYEALADFIEERKVDGVFSGELIIRIIVREELTYYMSQLTIDDRTIAILFDGTTGEVLARKDLY